MESEDTEALGGLVGREQGDGRGKEGREGKGSTV